MKTIRGAVVCLAAMLVAPFYGALAASYQYKDNTQSTFNIALFSCGSLYCTSMILEDANGNALATAPGTANSGSALPIQGVVGGVPVPVSGTFTASLGGFTPSAVGARGTPITVGVTSSSGALPTGAVTIVSNAGSNPMYCNANGVAATIADQLIEPGAWFPFTIPNGVTTLACIATGGSTTANMLGGSGLPTGIGGLGGGSGGSVTQGTTPWIVGGKDANNAAPTANPVWVGGWDGTNVRALSTDASGHPVVNLNSGQSLAATQSGAWSVGQSGTWTVQPGNTANTTPWLMSISQGGNTAAVNASSQLSVNCANCSGSGVSQQDATGFTFGTTNFVPIGGVFNSVISNLTSGQAGAAALTADRNLFTNVNKWAGTALGAPSNYGTAPGAVAVPGVNAFITNTPSVAQSGSWNVGQSGTWTVQPGNTANTTPWLTTINQGGNSAAVTAGNALKVDGSAVTQPVSVGSALPAGTNVVGFTSNDPCAQAPKLGAPISLTASGQIITGAASKKTYICSIDLVSATAQNIALVEGTGTTCATNIFGLAGGATAATGWNLAANGGLTKGSGAGTVYSPSADANATAANVCLLVSGTGQVSGQATYVQQ